MSDSSASVIRPLSAEQIDAYHHEGFLLLPPAFLPPASLVGLLDAVPDILAQEGEHRILERDDTTVRSVYGPHRSHSAVTDFSRLPALLGAVTQLLGDSVYIHQSKVNVKAAFAGDRWEWHQDYVNWQDLDGIRSPNLVNVAVFLDEVTEFNGPLTFIPRSHQNGLLPGTDSTKMPSGYEDSARWVATLTATEKFQVDRATLTRLAQENGMVAPKGPAGSVLLFHSNVLHASMPNLSPFARRMFIIAYNTVSNPPTNTANTRPEFLASRETKPLEPVL
ncbi:phytanoyl-CoA dioxygenase family protein [Streptomyces europaeiscabiei]|uniref:phytanoyl-CoA dioxygenase family protein n=1 Tax=Streptomyces europaeiscabiei TaxID=146819 RepID=UPI0029A4BDAF|nr:phytanoyl-CoA dioxygenase family protein [Streptomyces europaeiscabiei]MDX2525278.1 phytanoyl-CoA dioxygenase family protein [Streptomyces europaeiscabiei]